MSLLFPIIPYMLQLAFVAYFVAVTVGISSSGGAYKILRDNSTTCCPVYYVSYYVIVLCNSYYVSYYIFII